MPGDGLSFPVRIRCQKDLIRRFCSAAQIFQDFFFAFYGDVFGFEIIVQIDAKAFFRKVAYMSYGRFDIKIFSKKFLNGLGLGRGLHYY